MPQLGAALAFYTALSIAPLLVISLGVASMAFGEDAARGEIQRQMDSLVGDEGAKAIEEMIANANEPATGTIATALSVITLLLRRFGRIRANPAELEHHLGSSTKTRARDCRNDSRPLLVAGDGIRNCLFASRLAHHQCRDGDTYKRSGLPS